MESRTFTRLVLNGEAIETAAAPASRLANWLREDRGLTGTKIGCGTGDCGSCTIIMDGQAVCACLVPLGRCAGAELITIEGVAAQTKTGAALQSALLSHQAVQCGFCTPGFVMTAAALLDGSEGMNIEAALVGVLCRCTGYNKIVAAIKDVSRAMASGTSVGSPPAGLAVGTRLLRRDGQEKVQGSQRFGADGIPADALRTRAVRSPHHRTSFKLGDTKAFIAANPGLVCVLTAADVPGRNLHGVAGPFADQPVFAVDQVRFKGEAVAAVVGERNAVDLLDLDDFPVEWEPLPPNLTNGSSVLADVPRLHAGRPENILIRGRVVCGDVDAALDRSDVVVEGVFETDFVEHAYIEPEAGWAQKIGDVIEVHSCTQAPFAHRDDLAAILNVVPEHVRVVATAVGGGFGGKLDLTTQPFVAIAAAVLGRPVGMIYTRAESMATSTKRHPARISSRIGATAEGQMVAIDFAADFNTGAYASWGTAVANRVPVHGSGPYKIGHYRALTRAIHTHATPSGAFRGFGVPQTVIAQEQLVDELCRKLSIDPIAFRLANVLETDVAMVTGQVLRDGVGMKACLNALQAPFDRARNLAARANEAAGPMRRGVGIAAMFYGCGNTAMSNPSTIRLGLCADGRIVLHQGAVDAGQGSNTVIPQIVADALGVPVDQIEILEADTAVTADCGRTSASRQTFVTGNAALRAAKSLRRQIIGLTNAGSGAVLKTARGQVIVEDDRVEHAVTLEAMPVDLHGFVICAEETFDPPSTTLDEDGQGEPYAVYAFGAQMAEVLVDTETGSVQVVKVTAAHDVGRAINPAMLEGQVEGAVAQGVGLALMEQFIPGVTETFSDYSIPTVLDMPEVETILVEAGAAIGPFGAKGIGEPALVPTAAAILNAIYDAVGCRIRNVPATPAVVLAALKRRHRSSGPTTPAQLDL